MKTNVIHNQDCIEGMGKLPEESIDTIITDPPYGLSFMGKEWDNFTDNEALQKWTKQWSKEALRIAKPGAIMLTFGGTRTWHRIACGIEDAGWEIRDTIMWVYGSGFPKSHNIGKAVDKKNFKNWLDDNPKQSKKYEQELEEAEGVDEVEKVKRKYKKMSGNERKIVGTYKIPEDSTSGRAGKDYIMIRGNSYQGTSTFKSSDNMGKEITKGNTKWEGYGTALKPAWEPIIMAMKPYENTYAENALEYDVAGLNIDGARVKPTEQDEYDLKERPTSEGSGKKTNINLTGRHKDMKHGVKEQGRFPANLIHDGSEEVEACFPETEGATSNSATGESIWGNGGKGHEKREGFDDQGSASRYFKRIKYSAKASKKERNSDGKVDNNHPTVKPLALMEYLVELTKMPNKDQIYLDPFIGSGTTGMAVRRKNRNYIGFEKEEEYVIIARARIKSIEQELI